MRVFPELSNLEELKGVVVFIESYIGREGVIERMKRDLEGFSRANLEELKGVVVFIESYIGREGVIERMKRDLRGFSKIELEDLQKLEKIWGKQKMKENLMKYNLQNERIL